MKINYDRESDILTIENASTSSTFVIAHRLSMIRNADQVLVLEAGEIIERCTHHELLEARGFYYDLYMSQFRRQIEAGEDDDVIAVKADAFFVPDD